MNIDFCNCGAVGNQGHTLGCIAEQSRRNTAMVVIPSEPVNVIDVDHSLVTVVMPEEDYSRQPGFCITGGKGFQITFANKVTVSVQFGPGEYCQNREMATKTKPDFAAIGEAGCPNAEIALLVDEPDGGIRFLDYEGSETPHGWQSPTDFLKILSYAAGLPAQVTLG